MTILPLYLQIGRTERVRFTGVIDKVAVACCDLDFTANSESPHTATLFSVYTIPCHRGKGFARALIRWAIECAESHGRTVILLSVHCENEPAVSLYEELGFMPYGTEGPFDYYAYWRELNPQDAALEAQE